MVLLGPSRGLGLRRGRRAAGPVDEATPGLAHADAEPEDPQAAQEGRHPEGFRGARPAERGGPRREQEDAPGPDEEDGGGPLVAFEGRFRHPAFHAGLVPFPAPAGREPSGQEHALEGHAHDPGAGRQPLAAEGETQPEKDEGHEGREGHGEVDELGVEGQHGGSFERSQAAATLCPWPSAGCDSLRAMPTRAVDPLDVAWGRRRFALFGGLLLAIALLVGLDLGADARVGSSARHLLMEGSVLLVAGAGGLWMVRQVLRLDRQARTLRREAEGLSRDLAQARADAEAWKRDAGALVAGLAGAIDQQLERWGLTAAEQEVALLLLKGLSHREIGDLRGVSEATVRQQARSLYRKAGLGGRRDLAAFFLEDLLAPRRS